MADQGVARIGGGIGETRKSNEELDEKTAQYAGRKNLASQNLQIPSGQVGTVSHPLCSKFYARHALDSGAAGVIGDRLI